MPHDPSYATFNPHNKPVEDLPAIYGFNNGGSPGFMYAALLGADGTPLGSHLCSSEGYMPYDLGILTSTRPDRHEGFQKHYPDGYRMEWVPTTELDSHPGFVAACALNALLPDEEEGAPK